MRVVQMNPFGGQGARNHSAPPAHTLPHPEVKRRSLDLRGFGSDDWILLGVIAILLIEGCTDYILLCALGYLFYVGL